jgi:hypothetical protein
MSASAAERATVLQPIVEQARARVGELEARAQQMDAAASEAYKRADAASGDAAHELAEQARRDLEPAKARLATLEDAERAVSGERQRDQWTQQVADLKAREEAELDERDVHLALIVPAVQACREAIKLARAAEDEARRAELQRDQFEASLEGRTFFKTNPTHSRVAAIVDGSALLLAIERSSAEF